MRFVRYVMVQLVAYGLDMGGFLLLITWLAMEPVTANVIGKVLAGLFAFVAHRSFTFGVSGTSGTRQQALRYFTLLALNIPLSTLLLSVSLWLIPFAVVAKFIADIVLVLLTYWLSKRFIFLSGDAAAPSITEDQAER
jgi:putative flippase GtrA